MSKGIDYRPDTMSSFDRSAMSEMRREVDKWDHLSKSQKAFLDDRCLLRYLRARKFKVKDAKAMLISTLDWRVDNKAHKIKSVDVAPFAKHMSSYFHMTTKHGHPVAYMRFARDPPNFTAEERIKYIMFQQEEHMRIIKRNADKYPNAEKVVFIIDLAGFSMGAPGADIGVAKRWGEMLMNHYPESFHKAYLVNYPAVFSMFWTMVSAFMDQVSVDKVCFVKQTTKDTQRDFFKSEGFEMENLEEDYGGTLKTLTKPNLTQNEDYVDAPMK